MQNVLPIALPSVPFVLAFLGSLPWHMELICQEVLACLCTEGKSSPDVRLIDFCLSKFTFKLLGMWCNLLTKQLPEFKIRRPSGFRIVQHDVTWLNISVSHWWYLLVLLCGFVLLQLSFDFSNKCFQITQGRRHHVFSFFCLRRVFVMSSIPGLSGAKPVPNVNQILLKARLVEGCFVALSFIVQRFLQTIQLRFQSLRMSGQVELDLIQLQFFSINLLKFVSFQKMSGNIGRFGNPAWQCTTWEWTSANSAESCITLHGEQKFTRSSGWKVTIYYDIQRGPNDWKVNRKISAKLATEAPWDSKLNPKIGSFSVTSTS